MAKADAGAKQLTLSSTKKEMLDAYAQLQERLKQKAEAEAKPEQKVEEKKNREAVETADALSTEGIGKEIGRLRAEIGTILMQVSDKLDAEISRYLQVKRAFSAKEQELREIFEIEKSASTLMTLLEVQRQKREQFEQEMAQQREELEGEIESTREEWDKEKQAHDADVKERSAIEKKARDREVEEFKYKFERDQQVMREQFEHEKLRIERETQLKKEALEKELQERERALAAGESELNRLREEAASAPKRLEDAVAKAVKDATDHLSREAQNREELLKKAFEGETNVSKSRIEALQVSVKEQQERIAKLSGQIEKSYGQVQEIAIKAIEGSASAKTVVYSQPAATEQERPSGQR